jgi:hypothetical protein
MQATPLGSIRLPITIEELTNVRKEVLIFEVVDFLSTYHALLGWPCYTKFMVVPHNACMKLKMARPQGLITMDSSYP